MKNKHATDPRNGIQIAASCSSQILKTIYWPMSTKLKRLFPKLNNVPTQRTQKIVKMAPFPAFSLIISFEYMHDKDNEYALNMYLWSKSCHVSLGTFNFLTVTFKMVIFVKWYLSSKTVKKVWSSYNRRQNWFRHFRKKDISWAWFYLFLFKKVWNTFQWYLLPTPPIQCCTAGLKVCGHSETTQQCEGGRGGGTLSQGSSKHLFLGKCLNNFVANCLNNKIDVRVSEKVTRCGLLAIISAKHAGY